MLQWIRLMGLLPVVGKVIAWVIDRFIEGPKMKEEARRQAEAAIDRVSNNPHSEAQDVADQWRTIKSVETDKGTGTPSQG